LICEAVHGKSPVQSAAVIHAAHSCGNSSCCNPWHLSWKTPKENEADKKIHGTRAAGPSDVNPWARLTYEQALAIKNSRGPRRPIAEKYGVSTGTVGAIRAGRSWAHLEI
jgi:hypothetical protein